jgi:hypothetical protein
LLQACTQAGDGGGGVKQAMRLTSTVYLMSGLGCVEAGWRGLGDEGWNTTDVTSKHYSVNIGD